MKAQGLAGLSFHPGRYFFGDNGLAAVQCVMEKDSTKRMAEFKELGSFSGKSKRYSKCQRCKSESATTYFEKY